MCGIVGIAGPQDPEWIGAMSALMRHRGPDDHGALVSRDPPVSLATRRLSIIDLEAGHQPMANEDESIWVVFNGEIFNSPQLRASLAPRHRFRSRNSDTELLVHLYEDHGTTLVDRIEGMFAFVLFDTRTRRLFGARDHAGIKPLYYHLDPLRFSFASELKSILCLPFVSTDLDHESLSHYLSLLYVPGESSIVCGVRRLPPASFFVFDLTTRSFNVERYWSPPLERSVERPDEDYPTVIREALRDAVSRWCLSDVPIACSLSGGLDSSALVGLLAESGQPRIRTYTLGFRGPGEEPLDETRLARIVADRWGTDHHELVVSQDELLRDVLSMVWHLDEPYAGGLPSWYVFREVGHDAKVCLTATGGDELFGNYGKFRPFEASRALMGALRARRSWRRGADALGHLLRPAEWVASHLPAWPVFSGPRRTLTRLPAVLREPFGSTYCSCFGYLGDSEKRSSVLQPPRGGPVETTSALLQREYDRWRLGSVRNGVAAVDFRFQLCDEFLLMTDRLSMAHGVEARVPLLDRRLVESVYRIPPDQRTTANTLKALFKRAVGDLIPAEVLEAPKKGFVMPLGLWLRGELRPLVEHLLAPQRLKSQGIIRPEFYASTALPHLEARADHTYRVWAVLMLQLWISLFVERRLSAAPTGDWKDLC